MQTPSVGRIVHFYIAPNFETQAAMITRVYSDTCVRLTVFGADGGTYLANSVPMVNEDEKQGMWWCWPPRADGPPSERPVETAPPRIDVPRRPPPDPDPIDVARLADDGGPDPEPGE